MADWATPSHTRLSEQATHYPRSGGESRADMKHTPLDDVADPGADTDADEMDLFLLKSEDASLRQGLGGSGQAVHQPHEIHIKTESLDSDSPHASVSSLPNALSVAKSKRKQGESGEVPLSSWRRQHPRSSYHSPQTDDDESLPFHLKRKRTSAGAASLSKGVSATDTMRFSLAGPRALATDQQVAAMRTGVLPEHEPEGSVASNSLAKDNQRRSERDQSGAVWHVGQSEDTDDYSHARQKTYAQDQDEALDDQPLGLRANIQAQRNIQPREALEQAPASITARSPRTFPPLSRKDETNAAESQSTRDTNASDTLVSPNFGDGLDEEVQDEVKEDMTKNETETDPMTITWADLVSGSQDEVWDDTELVDVWSQAEAEYAVLLERRQRHRELMQLKAKAAQTRSSQGGVRKPEGRAWSSAGPKQSSVHQSHSPRPSLRPQSESNSGKRVHTQLEPQSPPKFAHPVPEQVRPTSYHSGNITGTHQDARAPSPAAANQEGTVSKDPPLSCEKPASPAAPHAPQLLPPAPPSHPLAGSGALGLSHDHIMQNLSYSSFYFGYYRALADISRQVKKPALLNPSASRSATSSGSNFRKEDAESLHAPAADTPGLPTGTPVGQRARGFGSSTPRGPSSMAGSMNSTGPDQTANDSVPSHMANMTDLSNISYPGSLPYLPMPTPVPHPMWPQFMPLTGHQ